MKSRLNTVLAVVNQYKIGKFIIMVSMALI